MKKYLLLLACSSLFAGDFIVVKNFTDSDIKITSGRVFTDKIISPANSDMIYLDNNGYNIAVWYKRKNNKFYRMEGCKKLFNRHNSEKKPLLKKSLLNLRREQRQESKNRLLNQHVLTFNVSYEDGKPVCNLSS